MPVDRLPKVENGPLLATVTAPPLPPPIPPPPNVMVPAANGELDQKSNCCERPPPPPTDCALMASEPHPLVLITLVLVTLTVLPLPTKVEVPPSAMAAAERTETVVDESGTSAAVVDCPPFDVAVGVVAAPDPEVSWILLPGMLMDVEELPENPDRTWPPPPPTDCATTAFEIKPWVFMAPPVLTVTAPPFPPVPAVPPSPNLAANVPLPRVCWWTPEICPPPPPIDSAKTASLNKFVVCSVLVGLPAASVPAVSPKFALTVTAPPLPPPPTAVEPPPALKSMVLLPELMFR